MKDYNTTVRITYFNVDWFKIKEACMTTISKDAYNTQRQKVLSLKKGNK